MALSHAVIIPTCGRREILGRLLLWLGEQTRLPDEVIISTTDETQVPDVSTRFPVKIVFGVKCLSAQRNRGLEIASGRFDAITFLDDDLLPATDYLERAGRALRQNPGWAVVMGHIILDGATTGEISWAQGLETLHAAEAAGPADGRALDRIGAQGGNMTIRAGMIGDLRFDERLALYSWQEDIDFSTQLGRRGRIVCLPTIRSVHLAVRSGRTSGMRFGYSQIINPVYLLRKGTMPAGFALKLMGRNLMANAVRSVRPETHIDRRGRLRGNLMALGHLLKGRIEPEYVLEIQSRPPERGSRFQDNDMREHNSLKRKERI